MGATLVWFRQDLRLRDNPALAAAIARGEPVVPVYVFDHGSAGSWPAGAASRWWLHHSLRRLDDALKARGSRLIVRRGEAGEELRDLIAATGATAVFWNRCYEPAAISRDKTLKAGLGVETKSFNAALLHEPHAIANKTGGPFQVFTPFWKHCLALPVEAPVKLPAGEFPAPARWPRSAAVEELELLPAIRWDSGLAEAWQPGEEGARARLRAFAGGRAAHYATERDRPDRDGTSALSPHLHFGEIGPRQVWAAIGALSKDSGVFPANRGAQVFLNEIGWREFAYHLLYHFPRTPDESLRRDFARFPWRKDRGELRAWQQGRTGYPIVDAGMRQLWSTGWMHNRVRMIVASFLVKHLRHSWQEGAEWFWDTLVDADLANNTLGWQWSAGCGADAAPYFRIFNPMLQGRKFDPDGTYVRRWVPELAGLAAGTIHAPWEASAAEREKAGITLGGNYPRPIVDHAEARAAALGALQAMRGPVG